MTDPIMQEHYDREDRMKDEADRLRDELERERTANEVAVAAIALTDPVIDKLTAERDEADAYILSLWRNNLLPRPMPETLRDRLAANPHTRAIRDILSAPDIPLPPKDELHKMLCGCGEPMGADGHAHVYGRDGVTYLAEVRCKKCNDALEAW